MVRKLVQNPDRRSFIFFRKSTRVYLIFRYLHHYVIRHLVERTWPLFVEVTQLALLLGPDLVLHDQLLRIAVGDLAKLNVSRPSHRVKLRDVILQSVYCIYFIKLWSEFLLVII
jgi:hypothetical protein